MLIYRLQNDNNVGLVYHIRQNQRNINWKIYNELKYNYSHNLPDGSERKQQPDADTGTELEKAYFDKLIYLGSPLIFGCISIKDLYIWFCPAEIGWYEANGCYIYVYDVPDEYIIKGTRQVAFDPKYAISKTKISHKKLRKNILV